MKTSLNTPTKAEAERITQMMRLGCVACAVLWIPQVAHECHHLLAGNRMGHGFTIPLCMGHHRGVWSVQQLQIIPREKRIAISDGRKAFLQVYPSERELWERVQDRLKLPKVWPVSKVLPRKIA